MRLKVLNSNKLIQTRLSNIDNICMHFKQKGSVFMQPMYDFVNGYIIPVKTSSKQSFEWKMYLKNEFRRKSKQAIF